MQNTQLHDLQAMGWFKFEILTKNILLKEGYNNAFITHKGIKGGDDGVDIIAEKNGERFAVQCKRWTKNHKLIDQIRALGGSLKKRGLEHGLFFVSIEANDYEQREAKSYGIELWDSNKIINAINKHDLLLKKAENIHNKNLIVGFKQSPLTKLKQAPPTKKDPNIIVVILKLLFGVVLFLIKELLVTIAEVLTEPEPKPKKKYRRKRRYSY